MNQSDQTLLRLLGQFAAPFKAKIFFVLLLMLAGALLELARPALMKWAIDSHIAQHNLSGLEQAALAYGLTVLFSVVISYSQTYLLQYIGQSIILQIRQKVFARLFYQSYGQLESQPVGTLVTRVTNDTDAVRDLYTEVLVAFISDVLILAGIMAVMWWMDWQLALAAFTVIPFMVILAQVYQHFARKAYRQVRSTTSQVNRFVQESLNNMAVIKAFAVFRPVCQEFQSVSQAYLGAGLAEVKTFALFRPLVELVYVGAVLMVLGTGSYWSESEAIKVGVLFAFLRYVEMFFTPIKDLAEKYNLLQSALAAAERIQELLDKPMAEEELAKVSEPKCFQGTIRFEHVWFAYEEEAWVLKDVSFTIRAGQFVGFAGPSGSGKTTLISLLSRFYEPQQGTIYLDEQDIRTLPLATLRQAMNVVFQDVHLFQGTLADNIALYCQGVGQDRIEKAARSSRLSELAQSDPAGFNRLVGYEGAFLSSGQKQLLSFARAIFADGPVLILDEATSSIDSETEALLQQALEQEVSGKTRLVIAHRLSTLEQADQIFVLRYGELVESGRHDELLEKKGIYAALYQNQLTNDSHYVK